MDCRRPSPHPLVLTVGSFDPPHLGHAVLLQNAAKLGRLVVGLNTDDYIYRYKGKRPIFKLRERRFLVELLDSVAGTVENSQDDLRPLLEEVKPDFLVIGSDWGERYYEQIKLSRAELKDLGCTLIILPYTPHVSSTEIKKRCEKL